jgi:hypothetical protein
MKYGRILLLALVVATAFVLATTAVPAVAGAGDGVIKVGDPTKDGSVKIKIQCQRANGTVETIQVSVAILAADDADDKAMKIDNAIDALSPTCFTSYWLGADQLDLDAAAGNKITLVDIQDDNTNETIGSKCPGGTPVGGDAKFTGSPTGGSASVSVGAVTAQTNTAGKTTTQIMQDLTSGLVAQGVGAAFEGGEIRITDNLADVLFSAGNTDSGLALWLQLQARLSVGGLAELPGVAGSSSLNYIAVAGLAAAALVALSAGGWYARRRWVR